MKKFIKKNWLSIIIIIILLTVINIYYQNQQAQIQLTREKQQNDYIIQVEKLRTEKLLNGLKQERLEQEQIDKEHKERIKALDLFNCLEEAEKRYWSYIKLNAISEKKTDNNGTEYTALPKVWTEAEERKKSIEDKCFKQYK